MHKRLSFIQIAERATRRIVILKKRRTLKEDNQSPTPTWNFKQRLYLEGNAYFHRFVLFYARVQNKYVLKASRLSELLESLLSIS